MCLRFPGRPTINTDSSLGVTTDISSIAVNPDGYFPCLPPVAGTPTLHCDLHPSDPGAVSTDAPAVKGFAAQLGFRVPNFMVSPFTRAHYVSHTPIDHTAIIKLVESLFIGPNANVDGAEMRLSPTSPSFSTSPTCPGRLRPRRRAGDCDFVGLQSLHSRCDGPLVSTQTSSQGKT
jgi:hypothetical protein